MDVIFYQINVSNKNNIKSISEELEQIFGRLDILVHNAAILYYDGQFTIDVDLDIVNKTLTTNLYGPWLLYQAFIPLMKRNGYGLL